MSMQNIWSDGMMGLVIGDALGCPVQFMSREEIRNRGPVIGMEGYGTYNMPQGTWTDDSSMALATLDSIHRKHGVDPDDIMKRFVGWYRNGDYTPFGEAFDMGITCTNAILNYENGKDVCSCGEASEYSNGNGSLMRILPACLYAYTQDFSVMQAIQMIHAVSGITHAHLRSKIGCGLYYFMIRGVLSGKGNLEERLQKGVDLGFSFYENEFVLSEKEPSVREELSKYDRLRDLKEFSILSENKIKSSGYVVDSLEAAVWCLLNTDSFRDCLLLAVNLGDDTDTIGAIAGGLAGLFYGYEAFPGEWIAVIQSPDQILALCDSVNVKGAEYDEDH